MSDYRTPTNTISIQAEEKVTHKSDQPLVTKTNWNPGKGRQEVADIARAKQKAFEEMIEAERLAANPELQRIEALEGEVKDLKSKLISFIELYGQK